MEKLGRLPAFDWKQTITGDGNENTLKRDAVERKRLQEEFGSLPSQTHVALNGNGLRAENQQPGYFSEKEAEDGERGRRREASVLVLNSTTKTLEESDFFRVGPRGGHIEGWTSGIMKGMFYLSIPFLTPRLHLHFQPGFTANAKQQ